MTALKISEALSRGQVTRVDSFIDRNDGSYNWVCASDRVTVGFQQMEAPQGLSMFSEGNSLVLNDLSQKKIEQKDSSFFIVKHNPVTGDTTISDGMYTFKILIFRLQMCDSFDKSMCFMHGRSYSYCSFR